MMTPISEPTLRTSISETEDYFAVEVYSPDGKEIVFRCLCSKKRYSLYEVHILLSKVLV